MSALEEIIKEIEGNISSYKHCVDNPKWASSGSDYHIACRKDYITKIAIWNKVLKYLKKEKDE